MSGFFSLVSMVAIGRIIGPHAAGIATYALAPFFLLDMSTTSFFAEALVQHPALRARHASSAATAAVTLGLVTGLGLAAAAPLLAALISAPEVTWLLLALAALLPFSAFLSAAAGLLLRAHRYRLLAMRVLVGQPLALVLCIFAAHAGFGPWALVGQPIVAVLATFLITIGFGRLGLRPRADMASVRELLPVAGPQFAMTTLAQAKYRLLIIALGVLATETVVAQTHFAYRILEGATAPIWILMSRLALPRLCRARGDRDAMVHAYGELAQLQALLGLPIAFGVALVAPDVVHAFLGPAWEGTAAVARIGGITESIGFVFGTWISLFIAIGRARWNLNWGLAALVLQVVGLAIVRPETPEAIAAVWSSPLILALPVVAVVLRELRRPWHWLAWQIAPAVFATAAMSVVVLIVQRFLDLPPLQELILSVGTGVATFLLAAWAALGGRLPPALAWRATPTNAPAG